MRKNDLVKRVRQSDRTFYNEMPMGSVGVIVKGPYEKNVSDVIHSLKPWLTPGFKYTEIKMVFDILSEEKLYRYCAMDEYERVTS